MSYSRMGISTSNPLQLMLSCQVAGSHKGDRPYALHRAAQNLPSCAGRDLPCLYAAAEQDLGGSTYE